MIEFFERHGADLLTKMLEHFGISVTAIVIGVLIAVPLGIIVSHNKRLSSMVIGISSILQTVPSLALLAMMVPIFGVGRKPAIIALVIYSLLPILRNTVLGMEGVDESVIDAAKGMGMHRFQLLFRVQLPLAMPALISGIRLSSTYVLSWATIASYIGAGGMGDFIFAGLNNYNIPSLIVGTLAITIMTLCVDAMFEVLEKRMVKREGVTS